MNTQNISTASFQSSGLLDGIDPGIAVTKTLPLNAVLKVIEPLIKKNDPDRAQAFPLYAQWLRERDVDLSIALAAEFWETFLAQFSREIPRRIQQWAQSINMPGLRSPLSLMLFQYQIMDQWFVAALRNRMCRTVLGRIGYWTLASVTLLLGLAIVAPITFYLATQGLRIGSYVLTALRHAPALLGF